jgi:hypothetical protein
MRCQAEIQHFAKFRKEILTSDAYYFDSIPKVEIRIVPTEKREGAERVTWIKEEPEFQCSDVVLSAETEKKQEQKSEE